MRFMLTEENVRNVCFMRFEDNEVQGYRGLSRHQRSGAGLTQITIAHKLLSRLSNMQYTILMGMMGSI